MYLALFKVVSGLFRPFEGCMTRLTARNRDQYPLGEKCGLGTILRLRENGNPVCVAAVRPLLLTGSRLREIRCLRWCEVKPDRLTLSGAKTGDRGTLALLSEAARGLLEGLAVSASGERVLPGGKGNGTVSANDLWWFWTKTRDATGIVAGRLLGRRRASTTNRYVHLDDATLRVAAKRVVSAIRTKLLPIL